MIEEPNKVKIIFKLGYITYPESEIREKFNFSKSMMTRIKAFLAGYHI